MAVMLGLAVLGVCRSLPFVEWWSCEGGGGGGGRMGCPNRGEVVMVVSVSSRFIEGQFALRRIRHRCPVDVVSRGDTGEPALDKVRLSHTPDELT